MTVIGAPLHQWTACLLLCSIPICGLAQSTNETVAVESTAISSSSTLARTSPTTSAPPKLSSAAESICPFRTINYITHTLPQQCLRTNWPGERAATDVPEVVIPWARQDASDGEAKAEPEGIRPSPGPHSEEIGSADATATTASSSTQAEAELETDSPFDNANFLSFEEWKQKNLARAGQSPDNVQARAASSEQRNRRRPVNVNALDSLGEEGEIEIDFSGFGAPSEPEAMPSRPLSDTRADTATTAEGEDRAAPSAWVLSKDAGKTCKQRFNYASFDCAATVLKTNPRAKSTSSILVENKDSYMLNECSAENKFIIVELCEDIFVDTVVLANYEFFSSMFRHFRVSVSDRYPVKLDRWRVLGTFEARNSREIQPFLVTEPQIWARYLRVEFLTHYGNEFYCPMSLLRVHGTTMMEQFRREEEQARGDDDFAEPIDEAAEEPVQTAVIPASGAVPVEQISNAHDKDTEYVKEVPKSNDSLGSEESAGGSRSAKENTPSSAHSGRPPMTSTKSSTNGVTDSTAQVVPSEDRRTKQSATLNAHRGRTENNSLSAVHVGSESSSSSSRPVDTSQSPSPATDHQAAESKSVLSQKNDAKPPHTNGGASPNNSSDKSASNSTSSGSQPQAPPRTSLQSQPNAATPPTQESFFKSISKRLQYLEANSTLSLQYIEEQSRILRDAFMKVEKKQLQKTEKFLDHLNNTVIHELKSYRNMYDQLWQSTILELEGMKERQKAEIGEIGARLSMVADELVWQKRMAVVQSTLLLLCLGLVLFVRSGTLGSQSDVPIVQQLGNTYSSFFDSPSHSPEGGKRVRRRRTFRNMWRSDTSVAMSDRSGHISDMANAVSDAEMEGRRIPAQVAFSPPTPATLGGTPIMRTRSSEKLNGMAGNGLPTPTEEASDALDEQAKRLEVLETQSGPATPRGSRDSRPSWEEVDRAVDLLKAEEMGQGQLLERKISREFNRRRSPLQRTESYNETGSDSPEGDDGEELFMGD
ncbi:hypothetical protein N0V90_001872 [Kalmusia sp. IMI 367209]|nr:hypothetical protein N0V90_001872 [Kalmusia sp. IMI 367209]